METYPDFSSLFKISKTRVAHSLSAIILILSSIFIKFKLAGSSKGFHWLERYQKN